MRNVWRPLKSGSVASAALCLDVGAAMEALKLYRFCSSWLNEAYGITFWAPWCFFPAAAISGKQPL